MILLHRLTIRQKIISIILTVTIISIITGFTIEIFSNIRASKVELKKNTTLDAKLIADYLIAPFLFNDQSGAKEILLKLANIPTILYGAAYGPDGNLYAEFKSSASVHSSDSLQHILQSVENKKEMRIT